MGNRVLLLGVYGMELVECGGALAINAANGGKSFASIMMSRHKSREQVKNAAKILSVDVIFHEYKMGEIMPVPEQKLELIKRIREVKPDIIITQDPVHCQGDLDPDRRMAMTLILESIALASRSYALEMGEPHPIPTIYYMTPEHADCLIDISNVWNKKVEAMNCLTSQIEFCAEHYQTHVGSELMKSIVPNWCEITSMFEKGKVAKQAFDLAYHMWEGAGGHSHYVLSERYRREGKYHFTELPK
ncbi:MAG: LmbE-like protein [Lachnospiraceae bacterium]|nr:LmbE-like protein [Lachnospiraceae bacterium]